MKQIVTLTLLAGLAAPALAFDHHEAAEGSEAAEPEQAHIPFANRSIRNWRVPERDVLLIEANHGRWYRAEFTNRCPGLRFTETLGFDTGGTSRFDRFSRVITRDGPCFVSSLVAIPDPDEEEEAAEADAAAE